MTDLLETYRVTYDTFFKLVHEKFGDFNMVRNRVSALHWACVNGCRLTMEMIFDNYDDDNDYDPISLMHFTCCQNHIDVMDLLIDRYPIIDTKIISDIMLGASTTSVMTRRHLLSRFPDAMSYICYSPDTLNGGPRELVDFLIEVTQDCDTSFHRGVAIQDNEVHRYTCIASVEPLVTKSLCHVDAGDLHVYFGLSHDYLSKDIPYIVNNLRLLKMHRLLASRKKSAKN